MPVFLILVAIVVIGIAYMQKTKKRKQNIVIQSSEKQSISADRGANPFPAGPSQSQKPWLKVYSTARFLERCSYNGLELGTSPKDYPQWMLYECGIVDPVKKHKQLIDEGYLEPADIRISIARRYKIPELKAILQKQGVSFPSKCKKDDLILSLLEQGELTDLDLPIVYVLSPKGEAFLKEQSELLEADKFRKYGISLEQYYEAKVTIPFKTYPRDIAWSIFNRRSNTYTNDSDFGLRRNNYLYMAQFLLDEGNQTEALRYYIRVLYFDLCVYAEYPARITPDVVKNVYEMKSHFQPIMEDECFLLLVPSSYISPSKSVFDQYLKDIFTGKEITQLEEKYGNPPRA